MCENSEKERAPVFGETERPEPELHPPAWSSAAHEILTLSAAELHARIQEESAANPALEAEVHATWPRCRQVFNEQASPSADFHLSAPPPQSNQTTIFDQNACWSGLTGTREEDTSQSFSSWFAPMHWRDQLILTLQLALPPQDAFLTEYLVGSLDEDGYLNAPIEEVAQSLGVSCQRVLRVLAALQAQEPAGIGARFVQECLRLQVDRLESYTSPLPAVRQIITRYLPEVSAGKYHEIAHALRITPHQVEQALAFIKTALTPFPLLRYLPLPLPPMGCSGGMLPDVLIRRRSQAEPGYAVEVLEVHRYHLRISPSYLERARDLLHSPGGEEEQRQAYLTRTRSFIADLERRWQTLSTLTRCVIERQRGYLEFGPDAIRPLTHVDVAAALGVHPSTVSRAAAHKYVMLPNTQVVPFSSFFAATVRRPC